MFAIVLNVRIMKINLWADMVSKLRSYKQVMLFMAAINAQSGSPLVPPPFTAHYYTLVLSLIANLTQANTISFNPSLPIRVTWQRCELSVIASMFQNV